jgi:hypothetical protein
MCWRLWLDRGLAFKCLGARFDEVLFLGLFFFFGSCYEVTWAVDLR